MMIDRRSILVMSTALSALPTSYAEAQTAARPSVASAPLCQQSEVEYWNDVALDLNAFDHSFVSQDVFSLPRAPGPTASARALGLVHAVMFDAVIASDPSSKFK